MLSCYESLNRPQTSDTKLRAEVQKIGADQNISPRADFRPVAQQGHNIAGQAVLLMSILLGKVSLLGRIGTATVDR
jgi:hypothetical protein